MTNIKDILSTFETDEIIEELISRYFSKVDELECQILSLKWANERSEKRINESKPGEDITHIKNKIEGYLNLISEYQIRINNLNEKMTQLKSWLET